MKCRLKLKPSEGYLPRMLNGALIEPCSEPASCEHQKPEPKKKNKSRRDRESNAADDKRKAALLCASLEGQAQLCASTINRSLQSFMGVLIEIRSQDREYVLIVY
jgi:hypothetical protein